MPTGTSRSWRSGRTTWRRTPTTRRRRSPRPPTGSGSRSPYLYDETQAVAAAYTAACTPDFFLFGPNRLLVYRGRFDASRPGSDVPVTGRDLRAAVDAVLAGEPVSEDQWPSMGCGIKWRPGREPGYLTG
jgi:hypothetical protein